MNQTSIWQQILDHSHRADPYPLYAELRKTPVVRVEDGSYVVSTYREIVALLHDPRLSSDMRNLPELAAGASARGLDEGPATLPPSFILTDAPEHDRLRRLLTRNFGPPHRPGRIDSMIPHMFEIVTGEIDGFVGKDRSGTTRVDIVDDFAYPFPVTVICQLLGVPREDESRFQAMSDAVVQAGDPSTGGIVERQQRRAKAVADLGQYFAELLDARHGRRGDDLLSGLLSGDGDETPMSPEEILSNAALLLVAYHETTVNLVTNGMLTLLRHPEVLDRLRRGDEPDLAARVVEELLRYEPPVQILSNSRNTLDDIEIAKHHHPQGFTGRTRARLRQSRPRLRSGPRPLRPRPRAQRAPRLRRRHPLLLRSPTGPSRDADRPHRAGAPAEEPRLVVDPPPYRASPSLRGPRHLLVDLDGVNPGLHRPP